jgi:hypothetical protein
MEEAGVRRLLEQFRTIKIPLSQAVAIGEHLHGPTKTHRSELFRESGGADPARTPLNLIARAATSPTAVALAARLAGLVRLANHRVLVQYDSLA